MFVLLLGMCPTLGTSTSVVNGLGMGLSATLVLICSNFFISILRKFIPDKIRIASYIVIIAGFVTAVEMVLKAYLPEISESLGVFIPLIVVNCIILARAEMFASKNSLLPSVLDGLGMGIGFTATLTLMGLIREFLGAGTLFGITATTNIITPMLVFLLPPGGFFVFGMLVAASNALAKANGKKTVTSLGCENCPSKEMCDRANSGSACEKEVGEVE